MKISSKLAAPPIEPSVLQRVSGPSTNKSLTWSEIIRIFEGIENKLEADVRQNYPAKKAQNTATMRWEDNLDASDRRMLFEIRKLFVPTAVYLLAEFVDEIRKLNHSVVLTPNEDTYTTVSISKARYIIQFKNQPKQIIPFPTDMPNFLDADYMELGTISLASDLDATINHECASLLIALFHMLVVDLWGMTAAEKFDTNLYGLNYFKDQVPAFVANKKYFDTQMQAACMLQYKYAGTNKGLYPYRSIQKLISQIATEPNIKAGREQSKVHMHAFDSHRENLKDSKIKDKLGDIKRGIVVDQLLILKMIQVENTYRVLVDAYKADDAWSQHSATQMWHDDARGSVEGSAVTVAQKQFIDAICEMNFFANEAHITYGAMLIVVGKVQKACSVNLRLKCQQLYNFPRLSDICERSALIENLIFLAQSVKPATVERNVGSAKPDKNIGLTKNIGQVVQKVNPAVAKKMLKYYYRSLFCIDHTNTSELQEAKKILEAVKTRTKTKSGPEMNYVSAQTQLYANMIHTLSESFNRQHTREAPACTPTKRASHGTGLKRTRRARLGRF
jgi:hypothetical protein